MASLLVIVLLVLTLVVLLGLGVPVAYALGIVGAVGMFLSIGFDPASGLVISTVNSTVTNYLFVTIPMFIMMAEFLRNSGMTEDIFTAAHRLLSHIPGGLAIATTVANGMFAALSGSSVAAAATMSTIAVPEMRRYDYDDRLSLGTVAAAGTFAVMIPPSLALIIYGILTGNSISRLFMAGMLPGLLTLVSYAAMIYLWVRMNPDVTGGGERPRFTNRERLEAVRPIAPMLLIVVVVLGGFYAGFTTPTEAGAVGAVSVLIVGIAMGNLNVEKIKTAVEETLETTSMIYMLLIGASLFSFYLSLEKVPQQILNIVSGLPFSNVIILVVLLVVYIILGMMMNQAAILILTLPITYPLIINLGYDPIWFGVIIVKTVEIGMVSPPFGLNVFVATGPLDINVDVAFRGAVRFIAADIVVIILLVAFPEIAHIVPDLLTG